MYQTPSQLAHEALNIEAVPGVVDEQYTCDLCGVDFDTSGHTFKPGPKFNNIDCLHGSGVICQHCKVVTTGSLFILQNKCAVYSRDGVISLNKDIDLAAFVLSPPQPPFVAVYGMIKQQHLVWRSTISNSTEHFSFRMGDNEYLVDRQFVIALSRKYVSTLASINAYRKHTAKKPSAIRDLPSFFSVPTSAIRNLSDGRAFILSETIQRVIKEAETLIQSEENLAETKELANDMLLQYADFERHFLKANYAEVFLALSCTKTSEETTLEHATNRSVKTTQG